MIRSTLRPVGIALFATAALVLGLAMPTASQAASGFGEWFKYGAELESAWSFAAVADEGLEVSIRRKNDRAAGSRARVMVLYPRASSAYDIAITRILHVFDQKDMDVEFTVINFENQDSRGERVLQRIKTEKPALIFTMGSESTAWMYNRYKGGEVPVVSVCSKDPVELGQMRDYESGSGTNFAFTSLNIPINAQLTYLLRLRPNLKNLGILVDSKNVSAVQTQADPLQRVAEAQGLQVLRLAVKDPANAAAELEHLVRQAVRTMQKSDPDLTKSLFWVTGSTSVFREMRTINDNSDRVPVLSVVPELVKAGNETAVLSVGVSFESNAHLAAIYGADLLRGHAQVGSLKVGVVSPADIAISFRKAREIGLRIPFSFFESASFVYDYDGRPVRSGAATDPIN
jgi:putative ABC transport system substrate-binding protein